LLGETAIPLKLPIYEPEMVYLNGYGYKNLFHTDRIKEAPSLVRALEG